MKRQHKKKLKREKKRAFGLLLKKENEQLLQNYPDLYVQGARANSDYYKPGLLSILWSNNIQAYRELNLGPAPSSHDQL
jgi:acyl-CoA-binding protein